MESVFLYFTNLSQLFIVAFCLFGYFCLLIEKGKIHSSFAPLILLSTIGAILYLGGLINILWEITFVVYLFGFLITIYYIIKIFLKKFLVVNYLNRSLLIILIPILIVAFAPRNLLVTHYDNYSHWLNVVKIINNSNSLPTEHAVYRFAINYPPMAALNIYFFSFLLKNENIVFLLAQAFLAGSCLSAMFYYLKLNKYSEILAVIGLSIVLLITIQSNLFNLLVDTLISLLFLSTLTIYYEYKLNLKKMLFSIFPILIFLLLVKETGIFFVLISLILIVIRIISLPRNKNKLLKNLLLLIIVVLFLFTFFMIWRYHVEVSFPNIGLQQPSNTSYSNALSQFYSKDGEIIRSLVVKIFKSSYFEYRSFNLKLYYGLNFVTFFWLIIFHFFQNKKNVSLLIKSLFFTNLLYFLYILLIIAMYIFVMPNFQAATLGSFNRYLAVIIIVFVGIQGSTLLFIANLKERKKLKYKNLIPIFIHISLLLIFSLIIKFNYIKKSLIAPDDHGVKTIENLATGIKPYFTKNESLYLYAPNEVSGYSSYLLQSFLGKRTIGYSANIPQNEKEFNDYLKNILSYQYLLFLSSQNTDFFFNEYSKICNQELKKIGILYKIEQSKTKECTALLTLIY